MIVISTTHRVVKVFNSELSKALGHEVQFALSCHSFKPKVFKIGLIYKHESYITIVQLVTRRKSKYLYTIFLGRRVM